MEKKYIDLLFLIRMYQFVFLYGPCNRLREEDKYIYVCFRVGSKLVKFLCSMFTRGGLMFKNSILI